jgi:hypothetical protein
MSALGLWVWINPNKFGSPLPQGCTPTLAILGVKGQLSSPPLQHLSMAIYILFACPGLNLVLPFLFFLVPHFFYNRYRRIRATRSSKTTSSMEDQNDNTAVTSPFFLHFGVFILLVVNVIFIVDIEHMLSHKWNARQSGEEEWGFGQVLALLLLVIPTRDFISAIASLQSRRSANQVEFEKLFRRMLSSQGIDIKAAIDGKDGVDVNTLLPHPEQGTDDTA